jgi:OTU domain-containing protein 6
MYSAVADQVNFLKLSVRQPSTWPHRLCTLLECIIGCSSTKEADASSDSHWQPSKENYQSIRQNAAAYMRAHPDEFLPFLPSEVDPENMMSPGECRLATSLPLTATLVRWRREDRD